MEADRSFCEKKANDLQRSREVKSFCEMKANGLHRSREAKKVLLGWRQR